MIKRSCGLPRWVLSSIVRRQPRRYIGTLSPYRRPMFGFFVDHTTDAFSVTVIFWARYDSLCQLQYRLSGIDPPILLLSVLVFVRTSGGGEFKYLIANLDRPRSCACILLNIAMYFGGVRISSLTFGTLGQIIFTRMTDDCVIALLCCLLFVPAIGKRSDSQKKTSNPCGMRAARPFRRHSGEFLS